ncbi:MAG: hypothetical protein AAFQ94_07765 [Bacteroidota bacterium]
MCCWNLHHSQLMLYYFFHIAILFLLLWLYSKYFVERGNKLYFIFGVSAKLLSGLFLWFLVVVVFGSASDSMTYLNASLAWKELFFKDPATYFAHFFNSSESISEYFQRQPRAVFFTKLVSVVSILTGGSYLINTLYFTMISFAGSWFLFVRLSISDWQKRNIWWSVLFVFPGLFAWTSGILKETIVIAALFILLGVYLDFKKQEKGMFIRNFILSILALILLIKVKYYVAAVFVPMLGFAFYYQWTIRQKRYSKVLIRYIVPSVLLIAAVLFIVNLSPNFEPGNLLNRIVIDHNRLLKLSVDPDFRINFTDYSPDVFSFVKNSPLALFSGLFRPMLWEGSTILQLAAGLQNTFLLLVILLALVQQTLKKKLPSFEVMMLLIYSVIMATFLAFSTPNFGTLERYKILYQPFLLLALAGYLKQVSKTGKLLLRSPLKGKDE